ncbi:hypothetical protein [Cerasicoccus arenae]|nr:hypothetical protein [Cerasicoccus arenae]
MDEGGASNPKEASFLNRGFGKRMKGISDFEDKEPSIGKEGID